MRSVAAVVLLAACCVAPACGAGRKTKTPPPAPPVGLEVLWQRDLTTPDGGLSPRLAASESSVFLAGPTMGLAAFAAADGSPQWTSARTSVVPPVVTGTHIVIASAHEVLLVQQDQDAVVWHAETDAAVSGIFVFGERVGAVLGNDLIAWDAAGARAWRVTLRATPSTPVVFANGTLFVGLEDSSLVAIDAAAGTERWRTALPARPESLAAAGDQLFLSTANAHLYGYPATGEIKHHWDFSKIRTIGQPMADDRLVYFALRDNAVHAYERKGGSEQWHAAMTDRPIGGPLKLAGGFAVALNSGEVLQVTSAGHIVQPAVPAQIPASTSLQSAVPSAGGTRIFTVTAAPNQNRVLTAWGPPSLKVSGK